MQHKIFCFVLLLASSCYGDYSRPSHIPEDIWQAASSYLIPEKHPIKAKLDRIFCSGKRVTRNSSSVASAGFENGDHGKFSKAIVSRHRRLPGYFVKMYTDDQLGIDERVRLTARIKGAIRARQVIDEYQLHTHFKVPKKWLYLLPPAHEEQGKNFILIAEDMNLLPQGKNLILWKSRSLPKQTLNALYTLLSKGGLKDSVYPFNIPFAKDGKIAIIDTEYYGLKRIHYFCLCRYLCKENAEYWRQVVKGDGKS